MTSRSLSRPVSLMAWLALGLVACETPKPGNGGDQTGGDGGDGGSGGSGAGGRAGSSGAGGTGAGGTGAGGTGAGGMGAGGTGGGGTGAGGTGAGGTGAGGTAGGGGRGGAGGTAGAPMADAGVPADSGGSPDSGGGDQTALDRACTPKFTLKLMDTGPKGQLFLQAMGGTPQTVEQIVLQIGRDVCRVLYRKPEEVRGANQLELIIRDYDGVAAKWGDIGDIGVEISTRHIQNVKNEGRDVAAEVKGILYHEMTHMYQHDDKPEGNWSGLANYYEAGADAVRIRYGFAPAGCRPDDKGGNWSDKSYCGGGWWWLWVDTKYPDFIYKLNLLMRGRDGKAFTPADATAIAGRSLDDMWTEYKAAACCRGTTTTCCK